MLDQLFLRFLGFSRLKVFLSLFGPAIIFLNMYIYIYIYIYVCVCVKNKVFRG